MKGLNKKAGFIVIDDDPVICLVYKKIIETQFDDTAVKTFTDPVAGLRYLEERDKMKWQKTVLLLDINMPVLSGWNILEAIENFDADIKKKMLVFLVSSSIDPADLQRASEEPLVLAYFAKPLLGEHLMRIKKLLHDEAAEYRVPVFVPNHY